MITSPIRPPARQEQGIAATGQLTRRRPPYGASLSFATTTHLRLLSDTPSRTPTSGTPSRQQATPSIRGRALASSVLDSPCQGSSTGLSPPVSTTCPAHPLAYGSLHSTAGGAILLELQHHLLRSRPQGSVIKPPGLSQTMLAERVRVRRPDRRPDHPDALGMEDLVEGAAELRIAVADQQPEPLIVAELHHQVARLLHRPGAVRVRPANSCRNTRISNSFDRRERPTSNTSANRLRTARYAKDHSKRPSLTPTPREQRP